MALVVGVLLAGGTGAVDRRDGLVGVGAVRVAALFEIP